MELRDGGGFLGFMESMKKSRKFFGKNKKGLNLGWKL